MTEAGRQIVKTNIQWRELTLAPDIADIRSDLSPQRRQRSIYEAVVYRSEDRRHRAFLASRRPRPFWRHPTTLAFDRAELRFGLRDARGLFGPPPAVKVDGRRLALQPGKGPSETGGSGFFTWLDASQIRERPLTVAFDFAFRGNGWLSLMPQAGDTRWTVTSKWPHPSFQGGFLPATRQVSESGFTATYRVGNLALGRRW